MDSIEDDMKLLLSALRFNKDDVEQQTQTLKTLAALCSNDRGSEYLHKLGGLKIITELFCSSSSPKVKQWSLFVLSNAVKDHAPSKKLLCIPEMLKRVELLLSYKKPNVLTVSAANFLLSLCANHDAAQDQARISGCLQKLLSLYRLSLPRPDVWFETPDDFSKTLWITVSTALGSTMSNPHNDKNQLRCGDVLPQAISMLKNANEQVLTTALNFIGHVISENENTQRMLGLVGGFNGLISLLKRAIDGNELDKPDLLSHVLTTISWGLTHFEENKKRVGSLDLISLLVGVLNDSRMSDNVVYSSLLCLSRCVDNCDFNQKLLQDCNGPETIISILIRTENEKVRKVTLGILQDCLPIENCKNFLKLERSLDVFPRKEDKNPVLSPKPFFVGNSLKMEKNSSESLRKLNKVTDEENTTRKNLRLEKDSFKKLSQLRLTNEISRESDQVSVATEKTSKEQDIDTGSILDILECQNEMIKSVKQQLDDIKENRMASMCGSCSSSVVISAPVKMRRASDMLSVRTDVLRGKRAGSRVYPEASRLKGTPAKVADRSSAMLTANDDSASCAWYHSREMSLSGLSQKRCESGRLSSRNRAAGTNGIFKIPNTNTLSLSSRFSSLGNGKQNLTRKAQDTSKEAVLSSSQRRKLRAQPYPMLAKCRNNNDADGEESIKDHVSQIESVGGESLKVTITRKNVRHVDQLPQMIKPSNAEGNHNGFLIVSRDVQQPSETQKSECSNNTLCTRNKKKVLMKRSYGEMLLRSKPRALRGIPTEQQSCHEKVEGWIEKNLLSKEKYKKGSLSVSKSSSAEGKDDFLSAKGGETAWSAKTKEDVTKTRETKRDSEANVESLAKDDQIDNTIDEASTPCNTLLSRSINTGYKVRRVLTFKKDNARGHGKSSSAIEGLLDCDEPVEKSTAFASDDELISEISSHCQQLEVGNKPETASDSNTILSSHEKSKEKCLGCYPFDRFPFFVLNSRNCSAALRKDNHTCAFHRSMINNEAKLESRIFDSSISKSSAIHLSQETSELKHFETESFKQRGSFSEHSSSKSRNASRQNFIHPRQAHGKEPNVYTTKYGKRRRIRKNYEDYEVENLHKGVKRFGKRWNAILNAYKFQPGRSASDLKDKYRKLNKSANSSIETQESTHAKMNSILPFTAQEIVNLKIGFGRYGARWKTILNNFKFQEGRTAKDLEMKSTSVHKKL
ncbi:telomere repeats-binding bouquet formation protein 1-like [Rhopilema esculentum]|uniref:telomere repeats-binding bouquet formation protein 1-like n=1 Tax=Rhopilema esculentum TaxID=499914 RepID=UPI0031D1CB00|eukprot:gene11581-21818_t